MLKLKRFRGVHQNSEKKKSPKIIFPSNDCNEKEERRGEKKYKKVHQK